MKSVIVIISWFIGAYMVYAMSGVLIGLLETATQRDRGHDGCVYKSYLSYTNIGFLGICELARVRFLRPETDYYDDHVNTR